MTELTVHGGADIVSDALGRDVETYLAFYALENDYKEPERVNKGEVAWIATEIRAKIAVAAGQDEYQTAGDVAGLGMREGRTFRFGMSPGIISCRSSDLSRRETTLTAGDYGVHGDDGMGKVQLSRSSKKIDMALCIDEETGEIVFDDEDGPARCEILEWSAKSRANMTKTLASLDYSEWSPEDGALAMVTLTLPGNWKPIAPDGKTFKKLVRKFEWRFRRNVGPWRLLWKLEFQRRGAPHFHALLRVPAMVGGVTFEKWLSKSWADVCGASKDIDTIDDDGAGHSEYSRHLKAGTGIDFSGKDFSDPRRISMYFAGHSAKSQDGKEYQHVVPAKWRRPGAGPGRFWGCSGLERAFVELDVTQRDYDRLRREMRKLARARAWEVAVKRQHGREHRAGVEAKAFTSPAKIRAPRLRRSQHGGAGGQNGGWCLLNDALKVAQQLAVFLAAPSRWR